VSDPALWDEHDHRCLNDAERAQFDATQSGREKNKIPCAAWSWFMRTAAVCCGVRKSSDADRPR